MNRRTLLQQTAVIFGGSLLGADQILAKSIDWDAIEGISDDKGVGIFSKAQIKMLNEIAETIIPTTDTPGGKAAKVGQFIAVIVSDCYETKDQAAFMEGLAKLDADCKAKHSKFFIKCTPGVRTTFLTEQDAEQKAFEKSKQNAQPSHFFRKLKSMVLWAYFTSEIGATQALRFVEYPGRYETIAYKKGDRAFS